MICKHAQNRQTFFFPFITRPVLRVPNYIVVLDWVIGNKSKWEIVKELFRNQVLLVHNYFCEYGRQKLRPRVPLRTSEIIGWCCYFDTHGISAKCFWKKCSSSKVAFGSTDVRFKWLQSGVSGVARGCVQSNEVLGDMLAALANSSGNLWGAFEAGWASSRILGATGSSAWQHLPCVGIGVWAYFSLSTAFNHGGFWTSSVAVWSRKPYGSLQIFFCKCWGVTAQEPGSRSRTGTFVMAISLGSGVIQPIA